MTRRDSLSYRRGTRFDAACRNRLEDTETCWAAAAFSCVDEIRAQFVAKERAARSRPRWRIQCARWKSGGRSREETELYTASGCDKCLAGRCQFTDDHPRSLGGTRATSVAAVWSAVQDTTNRHDSVGKTRLLDESQLPDKMPCTLEDSPLL